MKIGEVCRKITKVTNWKPRSEKKEKKEFDQNREKNHQFFPRKTTIVYPFSQETTFKSVAFDKLGTMAAKTKPTLGTSAQAVRVRRSTVRSKTELAKGLFSKSTRGHQGR